MKRQLAILDFAVGSLRRRAGKSLALALGLAFVVALFASALLLTDALEREYALGAERMPDLTVQRLVAGRPALIEVAAAEGLRDIPAVRSVVPRVWGYYFFRALEANVTIVGAEPDASLDVALEEGRLPRRANEVAIGTALADLLGLRVGDELGVPIGGEVIFSDVVGTFGDASALRTADLIVATPEHARALLGVPEGMATDLAIDLTTQDEAGVVTERIAERIEGARVLDARLLRRTYELTFDTRGGLLAAMLVPALSAFLLLAWERLTGLGDAERREIGVLKAVGWSTRDVLAARMWESFAIAFAGASLGLVLAYVYVFYAGAPGLADALLGWSAIHPPFDLAPALDVTQAFALVASVVVPFVAVSIVPAWRAAMIDPDRAMRGVS
ncbi:MAG TPA: FtsX-like permease family protein [Sandaracinaceae bacterium]